MHFFTTTVCDLLISIAEASLGSASRLGCYQLDVRALKQQLHDSTEIRILCAFRILFLVKAAPGTVE